MTNHARINDDPRDMAVRALSMLLDRDLTFVGNRVELTFPSHHDAINDIAAARLVVLHAQLLAEPT